MLGKLSIFLILTASLSCFGQVAVIGGYATTSGPAVGIVPTSAANAPLVAAPDIALPGSGPAVGAPINTPNDSRVSAGPSIANPNVIMPQAAASNATPTPVAAATETESAATIGNASADATPFEPGIQHFVSGMPQSEKATQSLAEKAVEIKTQQRPAVRAFNNDSIAELNAKGVQTGNLGAGEPNMVAANATPATPNPIESSSIGPAGAEIAQNQTPSLPQSDQPAPQSSATAAQQRHAAIDQNAANSSSAGNTAVEPQESTTTQSSHNQQTLPQSASSLPLFLLIGVVGLAGGGIYWLRR